MTADPMATSLWMYSLRVYERAGIPAVLIGWQDGLGADVNLALWCTWVSGFRHHRLDEPTVAAADRAPDKGRRRFIASCESGVERLIMWRTMSVGVEPGKNMSCGGAW